MNTAIGLFDSGIGATSIWREIVKTLPNENTILLADSLNAPYGTKTKDEIIALCEKNTEFLLNKNCKIIVVACNTATVNSVAHLREKYDVPFIGIEPAIKPASLYSKTKKIGILATQRTLLSEIYNKNRKVFAEEKGVTIIEKVGKGLVEFVENGQLQSEEVKNLLHKYLQPMIKNDIDYLVLGCTHYPYLTPIIEKIIPENIKIIDSGEAVAKQTKLILQEKNLQNTCNSNAEHLWITNKNPEILSQFVPENCSVKIIFKEN